MVPPTTTPKRLEPPQIKKKRIVSRITSRQEAPIIDSDDNEVFAYASQAF